ncbi:NAD(P)H:quinone oxidoreductase type 3, polypeptide A2 isoform 2-like protein [Camelus ferus]|nr:NAD(P)H:quinone oxidoreductase type 3, polypeptide A2 isoform 2-like protein [Camelus ferus]
MNFKRRHPVTLQDPEAKDPLPLTEKANQPQHRGPALNRRRQTMPQGFLPPAGWKYSSGFITKDVVKEHLPPPRGPTFVLVCGPLALNQTAAHPDLGELGYAKDTIFTY